MAAVDLNIPPAPVVAGLTHLHSGKVRDLYRIDTGDYAGKLLMVASDRVSAFDFVLDPTIPDKGRILTRMSLWWFDQLADLVPNHVVSTELPDTLPAHVAAEFAGRALVCEPLEMYPVECVARGYLTGSGLIDYQRTGEVCGVPLPAGLVDGDRLPEPIFTPATKAELGDHDENVSYDAVVATVGDDAAAELRTVTLAVYRRAEAIARERGLILADTKFEFGRAGVSTGSTTEEVGSTTGVSTGSTTGSRRLDTRGWTRPAGSRQARPAGSRQARPPRGWARRPRGWARPPGRGWCWAMRCSPLIRHGIGRPPSGNQEGPSRRTTSRSSAIGCSPMRPHGIAPRGRGRPRCPTTSSNAPVPAISKPSNC